MSERIEDIIRTNQTLLIPEGRIIEWPKRRRTKGQTINYKIFRRKLRIEQHEQHQENRM